MNEWIEIRASFDEPPADWSLAADLYEALGCPSSQIIENPPQIVGYLSKSATSVAVAEDLARRLMSLGASEVACNETSDQDWSELWKQHFKPRQIGRVLLRPTWEQATPVEGSVEVVLDPGQAFGTGDHPTTRLSLELLQDLDLEGKDVADVGCGSGILSIAARKLGANRVVATDIDPLAVEITEANARANGAVVDARAGAGWEPLENERFDVLISNIISATLVRLAPSAALHLKESGKWIVSGIFEANWKDVQDAAEQAGFKLEKRILEDGWVAGSFLR